MYRDRRCRNCVLTVVWTLLSFAATAQEDTSLCQQGWTSYSSGKYEEAIKQYDACMESGKLTQATLARTYRNLGMAHNANKDTARAIDYYGKALALTPGDFWFDYVNRGNAWSSIKEYDKALADYEAALKAKPDLGAAFYNRGIVYEKMGKVDQAKADISSAYAKGFRSPQINERMRFYQLPMDDAVALDRNKPIESPQVLGGLLRQIVEESNGKFSCFEKDMSVADVRLAVQDALRAQGISKPTANEVTPAFYTLYPCPFSPVRAELKPATASNLEGVWLYPEASQKYRYPPQSASWKQEPPANIHMCDGIGFYANGEMRVMRKGGAANGCAIRASSDLDAARQFPRTSSWNMIRDGRMNVRRSDVPNHVEEWDMFVAVADFEARGLQVKQGDVLGYLRRLPGNDWNISTMFWHLKRLP